MSQRLGQRSVDPPRMGPAEDTFPCRGTPAVADVRPSHGYRPPVRITGTQRLKRLFMRAPRMRGNGLATPRAHTEPTVTTGDACDALGARIDDARRRLLTDRNSPVRAVQGCSVGPTAYEHTLAVEIARGEIGTT